MPISCTAVNQSKLKQKIHFINNKLIKKDCIWLKKYKEPFRVKFDDFFFLNSLFFHVFYKYCYGIHFSFFFFYFFYLFLKFANTFFNTFRKS